MKKLIFLFVVMLSVNAFSQGLSINPAFGQIKTTNFIDDTVQVRFKGDTGDTSAIYGWSADHHKGPDQGLWTSLFIKTIPDSTDSLAQIQCSYVVQEFDYCALTKDSVFTACADTSVDTLSMTGVVGDTTWVKYPFSGNPSNGFRIIAIPGDTCSDSTYSTGNFWFHVRKKIGTYQ